MKCFFFLRTKLGNIIQKKLKSNVHMKCKGPIDKGPPQPRILLYQKANLARSCAAKLPSLRLNRRQLLLVEMQSTMMLEK